MAKSHTANIRARQPKPEEPFITTLQLNAVAIEFPNLQNIFVEELMQRLSPEDSEEMAPNFDSLGRHLRDWINCCFYNQEASSPYPLTLTELRERFTNGADHLVEFLESKKVFLDEGAQTVFRQTYGAMCYRLENAMIHGRDASQQSGQYLMQ